MKCRFLCCLWCAIFVVAPPASAVNKPSSSRSSAPTAIVHVNVIPMDGEHVLSDQTVLVEGETIARLGPTQSIKLHPGTRRIDGHGMYLIPGLMDAHVHLESQTEFPLYLANGVTTVFNLDGRPAHLLWRRQVAKGEVLGPTIFSTGPIFHQKRSPPLAREKK